MTTIWPESLQNVAVATDDLMRGNLSWVHDRMREWAEAGYSRLIAQERRETCRHEAFEKVLSDPRLKDEKAGPPKKGWEWKTGYAPRHDISPGKPRPLVTGWISPEAVKAIAFVECGDPLLEGKPSDLPYKVVRLAALCTACLNTEDPITPSEWSDFGAKAINLTRKADKRDLSAAIAHKGLVDSSHEELVVLSPKRTGLYAKKLERYRLTVEAAMREAGGAEAEGDTAGQEARPVPSGVLARHERVDMERDDDAEAEITKLAYEIEEFIIEHDALLYFRERVAAWRRQKEELWGGPRPKKTIISGLNKRPIEVEPSTDDKAAGDILEALRLKNNQKVSLLSKYACLSAVHDYRLGGVEAIHPPEWYVSGEFGSMASAYLVLGKSPVLLDHISNLRAWWAAVKVDVLQSIGNDLPIRSAWANGSFLLFTFTTVVTTLGVLAKTVSILVLPFVIVAGILVTCLIGAFQLRNDGRLSQKSFMELVKIVLAQLPLLGRLAKLFGRKNKP